MSHLDGMPLWASIPAAIFLLAGAGLTLIGSIGLVRLRTFYERIHAPTLGTSWGAGGIVIASMIAFTAMESRLVVHEILIWAFVTITTPVTLMLLGRAARYRDADSGQPLSEAAAELAVETGEAGPDRA